MEVTYKNFYVKHKKFENIKLVFINKVNLNKNILLTLWVNLKLSSYI